MRNKEDYMAVLAMTPEQWRSLRLAVGLSRAALARMAGLSVKTIRSLEAGQRKPHPGTQDKIVRTLAELRVQTRALRLKECEIAARQARQLGAGSIEVNRATVRGMGLLRPQRQNGDGPVALTPELRAEIHEQTVEERSWNQ